MVGVALGYLVGPAAGAGAAYVLTAANGAAAAALAFLALAGGEFAGRRQDRAASVLPFMRVVFSSLVGPLYALATIATLELMVHPFGLDPEGLIAISLIATTVNLITHGVLQRSRQPSAAKRVALIGSLDDGKDLIGELRLTGVTAYDVIGRVATTQGDGHSSLRGLPTLGPLHALGELVEEHGIDLLVLSSNAPRLDVFEEIARSCVHSPVRFCELSSFCERVFGHVPVSEINASWFQYIMHPDFRTAAPFVKRVIDIAVAAITILLALPALAVFALLIRRDGGPVLFTQVRIGEGGKAFRLYKLRTMSADADRATSWSRAGDPRVTPIGRFLRRTHLDELPQAVNVLKGQMSIVGPRPEQPSYVGRLETIVPFYARRHLVKPGITGWAQVRCGYSGSDVGSVWKICHDLYYVKHRSLSLDFLILGETVRTLFADSDHAVDPGQSPFARLSREA